MMRRLLAVLALVASAVLVLLNAGGATQWRDGLLPQSPAPSPRVLVVQDVLDGDTFTAADLAGAPVGRVRLVGVDAPELAEDDCWAQEAAAGLGVLIDSGARVEFTVDPGQGETDRYGRLLGYVRTSGSDGQDVGLQLLDRGHARPWGQHPRSVEYQEAAGEAQDRGAGLWGGCR